MADSENEPNELGDSESIHFVGSERKPDVPIDFTKRVWMVEFRYGSNVTFHAVNGENEKEALTSAMEDAHLKGERIILAESITISQLVHLEGDVNGS
jgi:hypothetical protein